MDLRCKHKSCKYISKYIIQGTLQTHVSFTRMYGCMNALLSVVFKVCLSFKDGAYLAVGSHDNFVYIYAVTENGRKYSRISKCTVSDLMIRFMT